jgi:peptidoglycan/LPS O-acetylase OafA/YrhL
MDDGYFSLGSQTNPLLHIWSLSIEEQFYFFFPIVFMILLARSRTRKSMLLWTSTGLCVSLAMCLTFAYGSLTGIGSEQIAFYLPFTRAWEFLAGSVTYLIGTTTKKPIGRQSRFTLNSFGCAGLLWSSLFLSEKWVFPGMSALIPVLSTAALLLAGAYNQS